MENPNFSYNIFHGNTARELAMQIQSTLQVPESFPKAKSFLKTETEKKPLCDVGNTLANARRIIKSVPEACKSSETRNVCSASELKGLPECSYQMDEVFSDEVDVWNLKFCKMVDIYQSLDPVPMSDEDNYEDIIPSNKDISLAAIHKMAYLWEQYDIPQQSSWQFDGVGNTLPLPEFPEADHLTAARMQELPLPEAVPFVPMTLF